MENRPDGLKQTKVMLVASKNKGKTAEITDALIGLPLTVKPVTEFGDFSEPEETGKTFAANAELKARYYSSLTGLTCLADDSGLEVDAIGGEPGVYSARFAGVTATDADNNAKLLSLLSGVEPERRTARFRCVLVYFDPLGQLLTAQGTCEGVILNSPRGTGGFGYDPLFYIPEYGKTMAEMTLVEKNAISHRGAALKQLSKLLAEKI